MGNTSEARKDELYIQLDQLNLMESKHIKMKAKYKKMVRHILPDDEAVGCSKVHDAIPLIKCQTKTK